MGCVLWAFTTTTVNKAREKFEANLKIKGLEWILAETENPPPKPEPKPEPKPDSEKPGRPTSSRSDPKNHILSIEKKQGEFNV